MDLRPDSLSNVFVIAMKVYFHFNVIYLAYRLDKMRNARNTNLLIISNESDFSSVPQQKQ